MDFRSLDAGNPLSDKFRRDAVQNVSQNIAALRNQKDLAEMAEADDGPPPRDQVSLAGGKAAAEGRDAADKVERGPGRAGDAGGKASAEGRVESGGQGSARPRGEVAAGPGGGGGAFEEGLESGALLSAAGGGGLLEDKDPATRRRKDEEARRLAQDDVPAEILKASGDIVKGQLHPVKGPKPSLREMKAIPEVSAHETAPAEFAGEMDIAEKIVPLIQEETD